MPAVKQYEEHILMRHQRCCVFWGILDFKAILDSRTEKTNVKRNTTITFSLVLVKYLFGRQLQYFLLQVALDL